MTLASERVQTTPPEFGYDTMCYDTETLLNVSISRLKILNARIVLLHFVQLDDTSLSNLPRLSS